MIDSIQVNLGNVGDFAKPMDKLIDVVAKCTGIGPIGTVLQAGADAAAEFIKTKSEISANNLRERAKIRVDYREELRQKNLEQISFKAAQELPTIVSSKPVSHDWALHFFDCAQDISDEDMQSIWSRILADEVSSPGRYTKRTLNFLKTIEKFEAVKFSELCSFAFTQDRWNYISKDAYTEKVLREKIGKFDIFSHFKSIGLLLPDELVFNATEFHYFNKKYQVHGLIAPGTGVNLLWIPILKFSYVANQLARVARPELVENYPKNLSEHYKEKIGAFFTEQPTEAAT